jgi:uncharacterized damage-inducible protein DinB
MTSSPEQTALALADRLHDLSSVIEALDDEVFQSVRGDGASGSVGAHVRHTLDHVAAIVEPIVASVIDYDARERGTQVERSPRVAVDELRRLARAARSWSRQQAGRLVELHATIDSGGRRVTVQSTMARELVFVLSHTIHHQAIIALLLASSGRTVPARFGVAPSTPSSLACARSA